MKWVGWLGLFLSASAWAQPLRVFLESSATHSFEQRQALLELDRERVAFAEQWSGLLPALQGSGAWTYNQYDAVIAIPDGPGSARSLTVVPKHQLEAQLRVELPMVAAQRWLGTAAASARADAAASESAASALRVRRAVVVAFHQWVAALGIAQSALRSLEVARGQLQQLEAREQVGAATELERERAKAEVERATQLVADAEALAATRGRLLSTLSGTPAQRLPVIAADDLHPEPSLETFEQSLPQLPTLVAAGQAVFAAERATTSTALGFLPTLQAQFTQRFTNATGFQNSAALFNAGLELAFRLDAVTAQAVRRQQVAEAAARLSLERSTAAAKDQLHSDWQAVRAALVKVKAAGAQLAASRRASTLTRERRAVGVATQLETIQAERDVFAAEVFDLQARCELATARHGLRLSAGLPLEESR